MAKGGTTIFCFFGSIFIVVAFFGCKEDHIQEEVVQRQPNPELIDSDFDYFSFSKENILSDAQKIVENQHEYLNVWNFESLSDSVCFHDVHLISKIEEAEVVVSVAGFIGCSLGCEGHLLMIYSERTHELLGVYQIPSKFYFLDIERDGISELVTENLICWGGYCNQIFSVKSLNRNRLLFSRNNNMPQACKSSCKVIRNSIKSEEKFETSVLDFRDVNLDGFLDLIVQTEFEYFDGSFLQTNDTIYFYE